MKFGEVGPVKGKEKESGLSQKSLQTMIQTSHWQQERQKESRNVSDSFRVQYRSDKHSYKPVGGLEQ